MSVVQRTLDSLPVEILDGIFFFSEAKEIYREEKDTDLFRLREVCKVFKEIIDGSYVDAKGYNSDFQGALNSLLIDLQKRCSLFTSPQIEMLISLKDFKSKTLPQKASALVRRSQQGFRAFFSQVRNVSIANADLFAPQGDLLNGSPMQKLLYQAGWLEAQKTTERTYSEYYNSIRKAMSFDDSIMLEDVPYVLRSYGLCAKMLDLQSDDSECQLYAIPIEIMTEGIVYAASLHNNFNLGYVPDKFMTEHLCDISLEKKSRDITGLLDLLYRYIPEKMLEKYPNLLKFKRDLRDKGPFWLNPQFRAVNLQGCLNEKIKSLAAFDRNLEAIKDKLRFLRME
jgi:hypothetical protein